MADLNIDVPVWEWLAIAASLVASAFFAGTETALTSLTEARTRQLIEESGRPHGHPLSLWLKSPERVITTLLFGNTLANICASVVTADIVHGAGVRYPVAVATGLTTFVVLTFCEITPKTFAKRHPIGVSQVVAPLVVVVYWLLFPFTYLLSGIGAGLAVVFGGRKKEAPVTGAEIEYLIDLGSRTGVLDDVKKQLLSSVLRFADLLVREIMVPRTRIVGIEKASTFEAAMKIVSDSEHSRIPVYDRSVDNVVGVLMVKDLVGDIQKGLTAQAFKLEKYVKPTFFVPELMKISRLLREFQKRKTHLAVVVDEFGGTSGLVSLEDVVEEIVGEIQDETDVEEKAVKQLPDGRFVADGAASLRECQDALGVEFPEEGDYGTLGGFITAESGKVPATGSRVVWNGLSFLIKAADERRVTKVEITKMKEGPPGEAPKPVAKDARLAMETADLRSMPLPELEAFVSALGEKRFRAVQLFRWMHQRRARTFEEMTDSPRAFRERLAKDATLTTLKTDLLQRSSDGTLKLRFATADDKRIESVYLPDEARRTLCVSTQVGCAMGCAFCRTGTMGLLRNLTAAEIVEQVHRVNELLVGEGVDGPRPLTNVVFMGMGEPLHNFENLKRALTILEHEAGPNFSNRHLTVSTAGLVPMIARLGEETDVKLAISLNATTDAVREKLMPIGRKHNLSQLMKACRDFPTRQGRQVTFEYVLLKGVNDSMEDARRLARLLEGMPVKVNLIAYNENPGLPFEAPTPARVKEFHDYLVGQGIAAITRKSRGQDIAAACGQLAARVEQSST